MRPSQRDKILKFCEQPRTAHQIAEHIGVLRKSIDLQKKQMIELGLLRRWVVGSKRAQIVYFQATGASVEPVKKAAEPVEKVSVDFLIRAHDPFSLCSRI